MNTIKRTSKEVPDSAVLAGGQAGQIESLSKKHIEEKALQKGIEKMVSQSKSFSFLNEEEDIYNETDLIERGCH